MVVRKLRGQSFGAVQQHRRSTASCRPYRQDVTDGLVLSLNGWMQHVVFSRQSWIARPNPIDARTIAEHAGQGDYCDRIDI